MMTAFETLTYNGFPFPVESKLEIDFPPGYDPADRAVVGVHHTLNVTVTLKTDLMAGTEVNGVVLSGTNETDLPVIKDALLEPGQALTLTGTGFGDLSCNGSASKRDIAWGPKPRRCTFTPLGTTACVLRWSCEVVLPTCLTAEFTGRLASYTYAVAVAVDEQGYCTRTITGSYEIPLTRGEDGGRDVTEFALNSWGPETEPPIPFGFRRVTNEPRESLDKRRVEFTVVDQEMPDVILPAHVTECRASHSVSVNAKDLSRCTATIRAAYTLRKGVGKQLSFYYFLLLVQQKLNAIVNTGSKVGGSIIPIALTVEDPDVYGRQAGNFSFSYFYNLSPPGSPDAGRPIQEQLKALVPKSALWQPGATLRQGVIQGPPDNTYSKWRDSMGPVFGPGQHPRFTYGASDDYIVDLCESSAGRTFGAGAFFRVSLPGYDPILDIKIKGTDYIKDDVALIVGNVPQRFFQPAPGKNGGPVTDDPTVIGSAYGVGGDSSVLGDVQEVSPPLITAVLLYDRIRVGAEPVVPTLTSLGGVTKLHRVRGKMATSPQSRHFGVPSFRIYGYQVYTVPVAPGKLPQYPPTFFLDGKIYENEVKKFNDAG